MTNATEEKANKDGHERLTFRVEPDYNIWLDALAAYLGTDKSKLVRKALDEFVENHMDELSPRLSRWWKEWREHRGRAGI
jgi:predicted transcriptional regulator